MEEAEEDEPLDPSEDEVAFVIGIGTLPELDVTILVVVVMLQVLVALT